MIYDLVCDCDSCEVEDVPCAEFPNRQYMNSQGYSAPKTYNLCEVCASTGISTMTVQYPSNYIGQSELARVIAQCTWILLKAIKEV